MSQGIDVTEQRASFLLLISWNQSKYAAAVETAMSVFGGLPAQEAAMLCVAQQTADRIGEESRVAQRCRDSSAVKTEQFGDTVNTGRRHGGAKCYGVAHSQSVGRFHPFEAGKARRCKGTQRNESGRENLEAIEAIHQTKCSR